jgi:hypothetical protein
MEGKMKRLLLGSLVSVALGTAGAAYASNTIQFDINGTAPGGVISVDTFDWTPDNSLVVNGAKPGTTTVTVLAQGALGVFTLSGAPPTNTLPQAGTEFTFQLTMTETVTGIGTGTVGLTPTAGTIQIWYDPSADSNQLAGTGYNDGTLILTGSVVPGAGSTGTFTDNNVVSGLPANQPLDNHNTNNYPGVLSDSGSGSTKLDFHVTFANPDFFLSDITSLLIGLQDSSNSTTPFFQADPAALVVGVAPVFTNVGGVLVNGAPGTCAQTAQARCDFLIQTDAASVFNSTAVPEPGTLALLSLGLLGAGFVGSRKFR